MNNCDETAIVIVSFDGYSDIWDTFSTCINKYWNDRRYTTYLITNTATVHYDGITTINTGIEISWSHRLRTALEYIKEKNLIVLLEDYLIDESVDNDGLADLLQYMTSSNIDYIRLAPLPLIKGKADEYGTIEITDKVMYSVNLQAAIWKRDFLLAVLGDGDYSAWEIEAKQKVTSENRIIGKCRASNKYYIHYLNGIIQGKWYVKTIQALNDKGIDIPLGNRTIMTDKDMRRENFRNKILHHISPKLVKKIKPFAKKLGFKFVTK